MSRKSDGTSGVKMQHVADSLGVSLATVSLAFRDSSMVAPKTRERVKAEADRLGYVYNRGAANLRRGQSNLVGLVVPDITNPFVAEAALGVQESISAHGYHVLLANTLEDTEQQRAVIRMLAEQRAGGIILIPAIGTLPEDLWPATSSEMPMVFVNRDIPEVDLPCIGASDEDIALLATDHLFNFHRVSTVSYFGGIGAAASRVTRNNSCRRLASISGVEFLDGWNAETTPNPDAAYEAASGLLDRTDAPEGLICHSDEIAWGVLRALREAEVPPSACRVVAIDGIPLSDMFAPSLTTVSVDPRGLGREAGQTLLTSFGIDADATSTNASPPRLIVRESCGCLRT